MGASLVYLEKPNKEIEFDLGENSNFKFAAGGMQGWRINMVSCCASKRAEKGNLFCFFALNASTLYFWCVYKHTMRKLSTKYILFKITILRELLMIFSLELCFISSVEFKTSYKRD